jgi:hypothetical protein
MRLYNAQQVRRSAEPANPRLLGYQLETNMTTTTMTTTIRANDLQLVRSRVEDLNKKAKKAGIPPAILKEGLVFASHNNDIPCMMQQITLEYYQIKLGKFQFVGRIEHNKMGNLIFEAPNMKLPQKYYNAVSHCDHCGTDRNRNNTFIFRDEEGEYKQVGSTCLQLFFGINPEKALYILSEIKSFTDECKEGFGGQNLSEDSGFDIVELLGLILTIIDQFGYVSKKESEKSISDFSYYIPSTSTRLKYVFNPGNNEDDRKMAIMIWNEYAENKKIYSSRACELLLWGQKYFETPNNSYEHNMLTICNNDTIALRFAGYLASLVPSKRRFEQQKSNNFIANIGDKITTTVTIKSITAYAGNYGISYYIKFTDEAGNNLAWNASNLKTEIKEGYKIKLQGTVKNNKEDKGNKTTILTRCKIISVISEPEIKQEIPQKIVFSKNYRYSAKNDGLVNWLEKMIVKWLKTKEQIIIKTNERLNILVEEIVKNNNNVHIAIELAEIHEKKREKMERIIKKIDQRINKGIIRQDEYFANKWKK